MSWDESADYQTDLDIPSGKFGKLIAVPGGPGPSGPPGPAGPAGPPGPDEGVEFTENKGQPDGYAPLGSDGVVPAEHLPPAGLTGIVEDGQTVVVDSSGLLSAHDPLVIDPTLPPYNVRMDRRTSMSATMVVGSNELTVSDYVFTAADVGKVVKVVGAGASGNNLKTTITGVSGSKAVLGIAAGTGVSGAVCIFGTDNAAALAQLFNDLSYKGADRKLSRTAVFPMGACLYSGTLIFPNIGTVKGVAENWANCDMVFGPMNRAEDMQATVFHQLWDQNVDCARVRDFGWEPHDWVGRLEGFAITQDLDNTTGRGLSFRTADGTPVSVIDGGHVENIVVLGACQEGFEFPYGGAGAVTLSKLGAWDCGYMDRKVFTANVTAGSNVLTGVSSTAGLVQGDIIHGAGIPADSTIASVDAANSTVTWSGSAATATASGVSVQRAGSPGIRYKPKPSSAETVHFDHVSGDNNSGGLLRIEGDGLGSQLVASITNMKCEFGVNTYRESRDTATKPSVPQGSNALVLFNLHNSSVSIRGLLHWASATSTTYTSLPYYPGNALGRDIGAAILVIPSLSADPPDVTWEALRVNYVKGSTQTEGFALRDKASTTRLPLPADNHGKGTNRPKPAGLVRSVADANTTVSRHDGAVVFTSLTAPRTVTLPLVASVPAGAEIVVSDASGSAGPLRAITVAASGSDTLLGTKTIVGPYGVLRLRSTGTAWVGSAGVTPQVALDFPKVNNIVDTNGNLAIKVSPTAAAVNYLEVVNGAAGSGVMLAGQGSDPNVGILLYPKGSSSVGIYSGVAGVTPRLAGNGVDANVNLNLTTKNLGVVQAQGTQVEVKGHTHVAADITGAAQWVNVPSSSSAAGTLNQIARDSSYFYVCVTTGAAGAALWKRIPYDNTAW